MIIKQLITKVIMLLLLWGGLASQLTAQNIVAAEYYFDTDPGVTNGIAMVVNNPADSINQIDSINLAGLTQGKHQFCIRYRNTLGKWSHTKCYPIQVMQPRTTPLIVGGEHFVDVEPGIGNGVPFSVNTPMDPYNVLDSLDLDTLSRGTHRFCVRYRNNMNQWSHTKCYTIQVSQPQLPAVIVGGEYFFDADPGIGNAPSLGTFAAADSINLIDSIDMTGISTGLHVFGIRYHNNMGQWSHTARYLVTVTKKAKLVVVEYVVDGTPGVQTGTTVAANPPAAQIVHKDSTNTAALAVGWHTLSVRAQDENGAWSNNKTDSFFVCNGSTALANVTVNNNTICEGTPVTFTATVTNAGPNPVYNWLVNGAIVSTGSTSYQTSTLESNDQVEFYLESNAYCVLDSTITASTPVVTVNAKPVVQPTPSMAAVCEGDPLTLTATGGQTYSWSNGVNNGTAFFPTVTQSYTVIGTDANGCSDTASTPVIAVNPLPILNFNALATFYCDTLNGVVLSASPVGGTFTGTGVSGNAFLPNSAGIGTYAISYNYTDGNGCSSIATQITEVVRCLNMSTSQADLDSQNKIKAYPNPTRTVLNLEVEIAAAQTLKVAIVDVLGRILYQSELTQSGTYQVDLQELASGTYFLQTINSNGAKTQEAIVKIK